MGAGFSFTTAPTDDVASSRQTDDVASSRQTDDVASSILSDREVETLKDTCRACRSVRDYEKIYPYCDRRGGDDCTDEYRDYKKSGICDNCGGSGIFGAGLFDSGGGGGGEGGSGSYDYGGYGGSRKMRESRDKGDTCTKAYYDMMNKMGMGEDACPNGYYEGNEGVWRDRNLVIGLSASAGVSALLLLGMVAYYFRPKTRAADDDDDYMDELAAAIE